MKELGNIQTIIFDFGNKNLRNLSIYIDSLNDEIKALLLKKMDIQIINWNLEFLNFEN